MSTRNKKQKIDIEKTAALSLLFTEQWRDIFEEHILPKLENGNELKFLKMSFRDARLAIRRSGIDLKDEFNIGELTSIAQLELAWDNYPWDEDDYSQEYFCRRVAGTNKLEYLVWAREAKNCDWDEKTVERAAELGNLAMVKYCVENECEIDSFACAAAAEYGRLEVLKYLHENDCPWTDMACDNAHENNHIDCLNYLIEQRCPGFEDYI